MAKPKSETATIYEEDNYCRRPRHRGQYARALALALLCALLVAEAKRYMREAAHVSSLMGELPSAAELYGEAASDMPQADAFDDDDDDEELDSAASNEYPDNENDNDENYDDAEGKCGLLAMSRACNKPTN